MNASPLLLVFGNGAREREIILDTSVSSAETRETEEEGTCARRDMEVN